MYMDKSPELLTFDLKKKISPYPSRKRHFRFHLKNVNVVFSAGVWWKIVYAPPE